MENETKTIIVVPCYNEEKRLDQKAFSDFLEKSTGVQILFVNDGSLDKTHKIIDNFSKAYPEKALVLSLEKNSGKAEAVRQGFLLALSRAPKAVGYWDADLSTPLNAISTFTDILNNDERIHLVMGARIKLLGRNVERNPARHYSGRIFATCVSLVLNLPVYDTQCGAKLFRNTPCLKEIFAEPFFSRWIFDVEILARMIRILPKDSKASPEEVIVEYPLHQWTDVHGSKLKITDFIQAIWQLIRIAIYLRSSKDQN